MKKLGLVLAGSVMLAACGQQDQAASVSLDSEDQKASYALGYRSAEQMSALQNLDMEAMIAGLRDGAGERGSQLGDEDLDGLIQAFQMRMIEQEQQEMAASAGANQEASDAFLAENAQKEGVNVSESGLQYRVLESGSDGGASPTLEDTVVVHYHGTLPDGSVFDSSVERGSPATFGLKHIIQGWQEALPLMKEGDKWELVLPPSLAYGEQGAGGDIGPNQALVFEVELLEVKGK